MQDLTKLCVDSLRTFTQEKYNVKLKAAHAHELVAAYFGYNSRNAMLADKEFPISNLNQADIVVMRPDKEIDLRRNKLQGLSEDLPDSYKLGEGVYPSLFPKELWSSKYPPVRGLKAAVKVLIEDDDSYKYVFSFHKGKSVHHVIAPYRENNEILLTVYHTFEEPSENAVVHGVTQLSLTRVAGHIGYKKTKPITCFKPREEGTTLGSQGVKL